MPCGVYFYWETNENLKLRGLDFICVKLDNRNLIPTSLGVGRGYCGIWSIQDLTERMRFCYQELTVVLELMLGNMLTHSCKSKSIINDFSCKRSFLFWEKGLCFSMELFLLFHWNRRLWHEVEAFLLTDNTRGVLSGNYFKAYTKK